MPIHSRRKSEVSLVRVTPERTFDCVMEIACTRRASEAKHILGAIWKNRSGRDQRRYLVRWFLDLAHM